MCSHESRGGTCGWACVRAHAGAAIAVAPRMPLVSLCVSCVCVFKPVTRCQLAAGSRTHMSSKNLGFTTAALLHMAAYDTELTPAPGWGCCGQTRANFPFTIRTHHQDVDHCALKSELPKLFCWLSNSICASCGVACSPSWPRHAPVHAVCWVLHEMKTKCA